MTTPPSSSTSSTSSFSKTPFTPNFNDPSQIDFSKSYHDEFFNPFTLPRDPKNLACWSVYFDQFLKCHCEFLLILLL